MQVAAHFQGSSVSPRGPLKRVATTLLGHWISESQYFDPQYDPLAESLTQPSLPSTYFILSFLKVTNKLTFPSLLIIAIVIRLLLDS